MINDMIHRDALAALFGEPLGPPIKSRKRGKRGKRGRK